MTDEPGRGEDPTTGRARAQAGRTRRPFAVLGFHTTHDALAAEQVLLAAAIPVTPIPTPPSLGAMCGIALRVEAPDRDRAVEALAARDISIESEGEISDV